MQQQQQPPPPQSQPQQRTYPQAIMSTAPRNQAQSGDFGAAPFLPPPPAKTGRPGQQQPQQMQQMPQQQQQPQFGSSMAGFATMPRAPQQQQQQQNGPMGSMAAATGTAAFPANFSNNGEIFKRVYVLYAHVYENIFRWHTFDVCYVHELTRHQEPRHALH